MEEYGCCKAWDYRGKRSSVLQAVHKVIEEMGYAGAMTWQVMPWNGLKRDMNYDFTVGEDGGWEILQFAKRMQAKW